MDIRFDGQTVIVTGAVRGIGRGIAQAFAQHGARVFAVDRLARELPAVLSAVSDDVASRIETREVDVTDPRALRALVDEAESRSATGSVDIMVASAGGVCGQQRQPIESVTLEDWQAIQDVNVRGAFLSAQAVAAGMKRAGSGRIVLISSRAGLAVSLTGIASYGAAKSAQIGLTRQLANELGPFGITVNSVAPGFMRTSPDYERQWQSYSEAEQAAVRARVAMQRDGAAEDIAHAVMFFASRYAGWVTGQTLAVTGSP